MNNHIIFIDVLKKLSECHVGGSAVKVTVGGRSVNINADNAVLRSIIGKVYRKKSRDIKNAYRIMYNRL